MTVLTQGPIPMSNLFKRLACFGEEDFFTAAFALFLENNHEFRKAFLKWIEPLVDEQLTDYAWEIKIQDTRKSQYGDAILDMAFVNPQVELWFEHKVGAQLNRYGTETGETIDQLQKYLDAAARTMQGIKSGKQDVQWPTGPAPGSPRIILFFISRSGSPLVRADYDGKLYSDQGFGLAFPENNQQLRWKDFYGTGRNALSETLTGQQGIFEAELTQQFLMYWKSLRGMWKQTTYDLDWEALIPSDNELGKDGIAGFDNYFSAIDELIRDHFGWQKPLNYKGKSREISIQQNDLEHLTISPVRSVEDEVPNYQEPLGKQILRLSCRFSEDIDAERDFPNQLSHDVWSASLKQKKKDGKLLLDLYVSIRGWDDAYSEARKSREVAQSFIAGLQMISSATNTTIERLCEL